MKKIVVFLTLGLLLFASCEEKEQCFLTDIPEHSVKFSTSVYLTGPEIIVDGFSIIYSYKLFITFQKHFCDGDLGTRITESPEVELNNITGSYREGSYLSTEIPIPFTNENDFVEIKVYDREKSYPYPVLDSVLIYYEEIKNKDQMMKDFYIGVSRPAAYN